MDLFKLSCAVPLEYLIIRKTVLRFVEEKKLSVNDKKFLYPLEAFDKSELSLTDKIGPDDQIRYFLSERVFRKVAELARKIADNRVFEIELDVKCAGFPLISSFIQSLFRMGVKVHLVTLGTDEGPGELTESEIQLVKEIIKGNRGDLSVIEPATHKIINAGDIFSADHLLEHSIQSFDQFAEKNAGLIGVIKNCINSPLEAEYYYNLSKKNGDALKTVKANYTLSMLFLRHHAVNNRNLSKGRALLDEAYEIIQNGDLAYTGTDTENFYRVFNRNGYGLILFREGRSEEAIELLRWGINKLSDEYSIHYMHRSVIMYNICLCYKRLHRYDEAIEEFKKLLDIDYAFPEYHLEMGFCLKEKGDYEGYVSCIRNALSVSPLHSDSHYLMSLTLLEDENYVLAESHAKTAWEVAGDDITAYNYAYILSLNNKYELLDSLLPSLQSDSLPEWLILQAEKRAQVSSVEAKEYLLACREIFPKHELINENILALSE
ncbi:tetratricopeptide repeat protein [Pantoea sp. Sc1]|uniref:tetratricopeptide repeat protein n=1 Tax=Pantoea sp. Sc1 TaxID=593105 RepID=UPI000258796B|nr:tetratricopeptide repeat protein [Pantoea sp. Sc1]EIB96329.1 hypothetical protein S7A_20604 [Pantoea sp. Sc1]